jgi:hypothetical protein
MSLRCIIKITDGRLAWSERHWWYGGASSGTPPVPPVVTITPAIIASANALVAAKAFMLPLSSQIIGAVLSVDDSERDGLPLVYQGLPQTGYTSDTLDPELSVLCSAYGVVSGLNYESQFYVSPANESSVNDQTFLPSAAFAAALKAYLGTLCTNVLTPGGVPGPWGWKGVIKNPFGNSPPAGYPTCTVGAYTAPALGLPGFITCAFSAIPAGLTTGDVVKLAKVPQPKNPVMRVNGRWIVQSITGLAVQLTRRYFPPALTPTNLVTLGQGYVIPTYYQVVPYNNILPSKLVKHNRGGTLGLVRGRSRGRPANV